VFAKTRSPRDHRPTGSKFQLFAAGEIVPALEVLDAVQKPDHRDGPTTAAVYYLGKEAANLFSAT